MKLAKTDIPQWPFYNYGYAIPMLDNRAKQQTYSRVSEKSMVEEKLFRPHYYS
ncbi:MAG: hypothetical protein ACLSDJ_01190 [Butyricimonas faecihominis]